MWRQQHTWHILQPGCLMPECKMEVVRVWTPAELCNWWIIWATAGSGEGSILIHRDWTKGQRSGWSRVWWSLQQRSEWVDNSAKWSSGNPRKPSWNCRLVSWKGYLSNRFSKCRKHQARGQNHIANIRNVTGGVQVIQTGRQETSALLPGESKSSLQFH